MTRPRRATNIIEDTPRIDLKAFKEAGCFKLDTETVKITFTNGEIGEVFIDNISNLLKVSLNNDIYFASFIIKTWPCGKYTAKARAFICPQGCTRTNRIVYVYQGRIGCYFCLKLIHRRNLYPNGSGPKADMYKLIRKAFPLRASPKPKP